MVRAARMETTMSKIATRHNSKATPESRELRDDELDAIAGGSTIGNIVGAVSASIGPMAGPPESGSPPNEAAMNVWNQLLKNYGYA